jgi:hypothetical protein
MEQQEHNNLTMNNEQQNNRTMEQRSKQPQPGQQNNRQPSSRQPDSNRATQQHNTTAWEEHNGQCRTQQPGSTTMWQWRTAMETGSKA